MNVKSFLGTFVRSVFLLSIIGVAYFAIRHKIATIEEKEGAVDLC